ncbi:MAG: hypothetical protein JST82_01485 [Bacteroidetes bacterium]|nr:hypothetical protein [Bacteroidota bacterium]
MKKIFVVVLASMSMAACNNTDKKENAFADTPASNWYTDLKHKQLKGKVKHILSKQYLAAFSNGAYVKTTELPNIITDYYYNEAGNILTSEWSQYDDAGKETYRAKQIYYYSGDTVKRMENYVKNARCRIFEYLWTDSKHYVQNIYMLKNPTDSSGPISYRNEYWYNDDYTIKKEAVHAYPDITGYIEDGQTEYTYLKNMEISKKSYRKDNDTTHIEKLAFDKQGNPLSEVQYYKLDGNNGAYSYYLNEYTYEYY